MLTPNTPQINGDKVIAIDFWATWCGPCRAISPVFEQLATKTEGVEFYKVDVDDVPVCIVIQLEDLC